MEILLKTSTVVSALTNGSTDGCMKVIGIMAKCMVWGPSLSKTGVSIKGLMKAA